MKRYVYLLMTIVGLAGVCFAPPVSAVDIRTGDGITVAEAVNGNVALSGKQVRVSRPVEGDVYCVGEVVTIASPVSGDVICVAGDLKIEATVSGSVRSVSRNLDVNAGILRNVTAAAGKISFGKSAVVGGEVLIAGESMDFKSRVRRDMGYFGDSLILTDAGIDGTLRADVNTLKLMGVTRIKGNLEYSAPSKAEISAGSVIGGNRKYTSDTSVSDSPASGSSASRRADNHFRNFGISLLVNIAVALIVLGVFGGIFEKGIDRILENPMGDLRVGAIAMGTSVVLMIVLGMSIIGLPLAFLLFIVAFVFGYMGQLATAVVLGRTLMWKIGYVGTDVLGAVLIGVTLLQIAYTLPFFGFLVLAIASCLGVGAFVGILRHTR